jgi:hypothetical protein
MTKVFSIIFLTIMNTLDNDLERIILQLVFAILIVPRSSNCSMLSIEINPTFYVTAQIKIKRSQIG